MAHRVTGQHALTPDLRRGGPPPAMAARGYVQHGRHTPSALSDVTSPGLIAKRISADLVGNLGAVRDHAEVLSIGAVAINPQGAIVRTA
jgi:hypothetical protein